MKSVKVKFPLFQLPFLVHFPSYIKNVPQPVSCTKTSDTAPISKTTGARYSSKKHSYKIN